MPATSPLNVPTPWFATRAKHPVDGEYDFAIGAEINGERRCIAETFGRAAETVFLNAEQHAAFIVRACNAHDDLLEALTMVRDADEGCKRDGLSTIPDMARAKIDAAIAKATGTP